MKEKHETTGLGRRYFLPGGIALAILIGLLLPEAGQAAGKLSLAGMEARMAAVVCIFLVTGLRLEHAELKKKPGFVRAATAVVLINLILAPALATATGALLGLGGALLVGLLAVGSAPTTLSSSTVITQTARGNETWAVSLMVLLNLTGIVVLPFTLGLSLRTGGVAVDQAVLFFKILRLVIIPLGIGLAIQKVLRRPRAGFWGYVPPTCVILIVWLSVSRRLDGLSELGTGVVLQILVLAAGLHLALLGAAFLAGNRLGLGAAERRAVAFVGAQKSLPLSISVLLMLPGAGKTIETATVVAVLLYFPQILIDSILAARLARTPAGS